MDGNTALQMPGAAARDKAEGEEANEDVKAFLDALAALVRDTVVRFEETVGRVTDMVMPGGCRKADRDLIVTLQNFDRLQQEFAALGEALSRYASATNRLSDGDTDHRQLGHEVVSSICMADLKERFLHQLRELQGDAVDATADAEGEEAIF
jgi:hypothetical protein